MTQQTIDIEGLPEGRKIVQFQDSPDTENHQGYITALCDDGTLWSYSSGSWSKFPIIPVPVVKPEKIQPRRKVLEKTGEERSVSYGDWYEDENGNVIPYLNKSFGTRRTYKIWKEVKE